MIERYVYVRLHEQSEESRRAVAANAKALLSGLPGVVSAHTGLPADDHAAAGWDVMFRVVFANMEDLQNYSEDPTHVGWVQDYLNPRAKVKKAWNFHVA